MKQAIIMGFFCAALAGCADPLRDVPRLSDVEGAPAAEQQNPFRRLFARSNADDPADAMETGEPGEAAEQDADAPAERQTVAEPAPRRPGLFAAMFRPAPSDAAAAPAATGPDAATAQPGETLPFAQIARVCNMPRDRLGARVERRAGLTLWDSFPNSTAARPHYITGFTDGCARTFTAALTMVGDPALHELERYTSRAPYTETDIAYETVKRRVCGTGRGTPCGAAMAQLNRQVMMISAYDAFESGDAATIMIADRTVRAISRRAR